MRRKTRILANKGGGEMLQKGGEKGEGEEKER